MVNDEPGMSPSRRRKRKAFAIAGVLFVVMVLGVIMDFIKKGQAPQFPAWWILVAIAVFAFLFGMVLMLLLAIEGVGVRLNRTPNPGQDSRDTAGHIPQP